MKFVARASRRLQIRVGTEPEVVEAYLQYVETAEASTTRRCWCIGDRSRMFMNSPG